MKTAAIAVLCVLMACPLLSQEKAPPDKKNCLISGVVIKEPGRLPLKKATINLVAEDQEKDRNYTITTDADGRFSLENVLPGRYQILLERTGYVAINARKRRLETRTLSLSPGQQLTDLRLTMLATATVMGKVVDEDGDPLPTVDVSVLRKRYGKIEWEPEKSERTNDLGEYRISGLLPGRYYLVANPAPDYSSFRNVEEKESDEPRNMRPITTYYPGTTDRNQATSIELRSGDEMPVNFTMVPARTYTVRGKVLGLSPDRQASVLFNAREYSLVFNFTEVDKEGNFEVRGVAPGSYLAMAFVDEEKETFRTARQIVDVVAADVEDVRLAPVPSGTVQGHLVGDRLPSSSSAHVWLQPLSDDLYGFPLGMGGEAGVGRGGRVKSDGSFELKNVPSGQFTINFRGQSSEWKRYYIRSVRLNGAPADTGFTINGNAGPLIVMLTNHAAVIQGSAIDEDDKPVSDCTVVAVPEEQYRKLHARFGKAQTDQNGRFTIRGLAPGTYTLYAWQDLDGQPYYEEDFLKSQEANGKSVRAESENDPAVIVKAIAIPEDAR